LIGRGVSPLIAEAAGALQVRSFLIDGEAVACGDDGVPVFDKVRSRRADRYVFLSAFDLLDINGLDLRCERLEIRKRQLSMLLRNARFGLGFNDHIDEPGDVVFRHACKLGFEGIVAAGLALSLQPILAGLRLSRNPRHGERRDVMILLMLLPATAAHARPWASSAEAAGFEVPEQDED
jgi:hypothetical protein